MLGRQLSLDLGIRSMHSPLYYMRSNAHLCRSGRYWIFLDVESDKYLALRSDELSLLGPWIHGWQDVYDDEKPPNYRLSADATNLANDLIARGILSESPRDAKNAAALKIVRPKSSLLNSTSPDSKLSPARYIAAFAIACARADWLLRTKEIRTIIRRASSRKLKHHMAREHHETQRMISLAQCFNRLRLLYPREYLCLFDSIALVEFLAMYSQYPSWVFGVVAEPFEAHCWLQEGDVLLNDTLERSSVYCPIMSV